MLSFLIWECRLNFFQRLIITYDEYVHLEEGWRREREYQENLTRLSCFYSILPHRSKNSHLRKPSDLWKIGSEIERMGRAVRMTDEQKRKRRKETRILTYACKRKGIKLRMV